MFLRFALLVLLLATGALPAAAQSIGTAAAVNQSAHRAPPGGAIRTIALGDHVVLNERITTDDIGLVQILFADGTTLMLGPRSDLVIDSFFYDPAAKEAKLAATMTKGALRFIGGLVSKRPDSAHIMTPVGTIGIRGAIADIVLDPPAGTPPHVDMHFGTEVTLSRGVELVSRLFEAGYSMVMGGDGNVGVQKTPPAWTNQIQKSLAGSPGTSGGSLNKPTDETVAESGVPKGNSLTLNIDPTGAPLPLTAAEIKELIAAVASYDELREFVSPRAGTGATGGLLYAYTIDVHGNILSTDWWPATTKGGTLGSATLTTLLFDRDGLPVAGTFSVTLVGTPCNVGDCSLEFTISPDGTFGSANGQTFTLEDFPGTTVELIAPQDVTLPPGVTYCECKFLDWAFWELRENGTLLAGGAAAVAERHTSAGELHTLGVQELAGTEATYSGHAAGYAGTLNGPAYVAAGDFDMTWSFAHRTGDVDITNFDGRNFRSRVGRSAGFVRQRRPDTGGRRPGRLHGERRNVERCRHFCRRAWPGPPLTHVRAPSARSPSPAAPPASPGSPAGRKGSPLPRGSPSPRRPR